jgi:hypothetical protein
MAKLNWNKSSGRGMSCSFSSGTYHYREPKITHPERGTKFLYCKVLNWAIYNNGILINVELMRKTIIVIAKGKFWIELLKRGLENNRIIAINAESGYAKINNIKHNILILKHIKFE